VDDIFRYWHSKGYNRPISLACVCLANCPLLLREAFEKAIAGCASAHRATAGALRCPAHSFIQGLANLVLTLHLMLVMFVCRRLLLVVIGNLRGWRWVNNPWFRLGHLATILVVVAEAGWVLSAPLTTLEMWLRAQAGNATYAGGFYRILVPATAVLRRPRLVVHAAYSLSRDAVLASWWGLPAALAAFGLRLGVR